MINLKISLRKSAIIGFSAISLSTLAVSAQAANLVTNGNFESYSGGYGTNNLPSQLNDAGTNGYTKLTGWTVGPGSSGTYGFLINPNTVDRTGSYSPRYTNNFSLWGPNNGSANELTGSPDGGLYLALDGANDWRGTGISQTISGLTIGQQYYVNFSWAAAQQKGFDGATTEQVQVSFAGSSQSTSVYNLPNHGFSGWMQQKFSFTANSVSSVLNFLAIGTPNGQPPFALLDGVSVEAVVTPPASSSIAVPEPLTILGAVTASAFGIVFKRKQSNNDVNKKG